MIHKAGDAPLEQEENLPEEMDTIREQLDNMGNKLQDIRIEYTPPPTRQRQRSRRTMRERAEPSWYNTPAAGAPAEQTEPETFAFYAEHWETRARETGTTMRELSDLIPYINSVICRSVWIHF